MTNRCPDCGDPFPRPWVTEEDCPGLSMWRCWDCGTTFWGENDLV